MNSILQAQFEDRLSNSTQFTKTGPASISIIISAYNEEMRIENGLERTFSFCTLAGWDFEIIIAAEGSRDKTIEIIQDTDRIKIITGDKRIGKGGSIKNASMYQRNSSRIWT